MEPKRVLVRHRYPIKWLYKRLPRHQFLIVAGIGVGLSAGLMAVLLKTSVHYFNQLLVQSTTWGFPAWTIVFFPAVGILLSVAFVQFVLKGKDGRGIVYVLRDIARNSSFVEKSKMYSQVVTSALTVGFGGSSGLEGPIAVTGAAIGSNFGRVYRISYKERTLLLAAGSAAGIAAVFNAPIAGVMFAIEVLLAGVVFAEFIPLLIAAVCGALCSKIILHEELLFHFHQRQEFDYTNVPYYLILGLVCGAVAYYYSFMAHTIEHFIARIRLNIWAKALLGGATLALFCIILPPLFGEGYLTIQALADGSVSTIENTLIPLDFLGEFKVLVLLGLLALVKVFATTITLKSGGNGGNFAPSLFVGATTGFFISRLINQLQWAKVPESNFTLVGMAGVLAGVMYAPLTAIFLIAEITGGYDLMIPLMIVAATAYLFNKSIHTHSLEFRKLAELGQIFTGHKDQNVSTTLFTPKMMDTDVQTISPDASLVQLIQQIKVSARNVFAVVNQQHELLGLVHLEDIKEIIFEPEANMHLTVSDLMKKPTYCVELHTPLRDILHQFEISGAYNLPVLQGKKYMGFASRSKVLTAYREELIRQS